MSGGSMGYLYSQLREYCNDGYTHDPELTEMLSDLCDVLHDMEWYEDSDIREEDYLASVKQFKETWLSAGSGTLLESRLREHLDKEFDVLRLHCYRILGIRTEEWTR